eukprot:CAMPEP_0181307308 /NCGR_PEP_ID=MMETSP1101-20121128/10801_1 /TAXON_ID=46948 /ORGANISM="Rhodomonas abbreviata, Strain Caron Lab Isolate" /LENGTH=332 /DNA_ID=CAMNT_0023413497 /DNA_START=56 /DNA_END=1054 /DNA_ORIENTATION=-
MSSTSQKCSAPALPSNEDFPFMGFGTMEHADGSKKPEDIFEAVKKALTVGYRHLDTAELYQTQELVGKAVAESGVDRDQIFITSKLKGMPCGEYSAVKQRTSSMLKRMSLDRFDLLLMHWPGPETANWEADPEDLAKSCDFSWFRENLKMAWDNMLRLKAEGLVRHVGVSNFYPAHMAELKKQFPSLPPFANQINVDALNQETDFVQSMHKDGIAVIAYRPVAFIPVYEMAASMGDNTSTVLDDAAKKFGASSKQQLVLAWLMSRGIRVIPKSASAANIQANYDALSLLGKGELAPDALDPLKEGSEVVAMCQGVDEYAAALKDVAANASSR